MLTHSKINALHHSGRKGPDKHLGRDQLYLVILPSNIKSWRLRYRINGREDTFVIGRYPTVTLKEARQAANQAQILVNQGINPKLDRRRRRDEQKAKQTHLVKYVANQWLAKQEHENAESTLRKHRSRLAKYLLPELRDFSVHNLTRKQILKIGEDIQAKGALHEVHRVLRLCKQILEYATVTDLIPYNIAYGLTKALITPKTTHRPAPLNTDEIANVLRRMHTHQGSPQVGACLKLVPHLFMSPIDIAHGRWTDIDLQTGIWSFRRQKSGVQTVTPLSTCVQSHLEKMCQIYPDSPWLFPSPLDEDWTYTRGYVSQIRENYSWQTGPLEHHVANVIQTQTPINPGNFGGPLVNNDAELVGINSFRSDGEGINFAVALSTVEKFIKDAKNIERSIAINMDFETLVHTEDENNNGNPDVYHFDQNKNEIVDRIAFDRDEDRYIELQ